METQAIYKTDVEDVATKALAIPDQARAIVVVDNESMARANTLLMDIRAIRKEIDATFDPIIKKAHEAHKAANQAKKNAEAPLIEAENYLKPAIRKYMDEQERLRREEEARLREEARKAEEERRLQEALLAEQEGNHEEAEAIIQEEPVFIPPPIVENNLPKVDMRLFRKTWKVRVVSLKALVQAAAKTDTLLPYLMANETALNQLARATKGAVAIDGVEFYEE